MKTRTIFIFLIFLTILLMSCNVLTNAGVKIINPSNVIISENRDVSGFNAIEFSTLGKINLMQGDKESLNISGPNNVVPEIVTEVKNGTLIIRTKENLNFTPLRNENPLTFTIVVKELTSLLVSGAGDIQMETLSTPSMDINLSGAGKVVQNQITADNLNITLSGVGGIDISGQATQATIDISVTDQLTGNISGGGNVSYYGEPQTNTTSTGLGTFKSLGSK